MGLKKYEIITVGSDRRVRALRSWAVGGRYVNIGDVGGIVYDEKTLSQDGACWLFRGNFGFPGARIGGDSIVDVGEATLSATGTPAVDILGSSVLVGSKLLFESDQTAANAVVLTAADFEQGDYTFAAGAKSENQKVNSPLVVRIKSPIFMGGVSKTFKLDVPGYVVQAFGLDADLVMVNSTANTVTGAGVTLSVPAAQYCLIRLRKDPITNTVPADATTAAITFTGTYETKLVMVDSRLELNPATSTGVITIRPGGTYAVTPGAKYPDSIIADSKVTINAISNRGVRFMSDLSNVNAMIDATTTDAQSVGTYRSVNNLVFSGVLTGALGIEMPKLVQAYDCDNMVVSPTNFPGLAAMRTAGVPIRFYNCNLIEGRFYHHEQIANTYRDINFDLATADLGKTFSADRTLGSSEVNGMYRTILNGLPGPLIESYESVKDLVVTQNQKMYNTTIYADAYLNGAFDIQGTNVFGNSMKHEASNTQNVMAVQGRFNTSTVGEKITGVVSDNTNVCVPTPFRVNGPKGLVISNLPAGYTALIFLTDANDTIATTSASITGLSSAALKSCKAYIRFRKSSGDPITPDDVKGVTVTVYNGCKIVNTGATAVSMKGNIRVEDNATLVNASVVGSGYFGGNSVAYYNPAVWASLDINGTVFMKDNAVFAPTSLRGSCTLVHMRDNAKFIGSVTAINTGLSFIMGNNAIIEGISNTRSGVVMYGNARVTPTGVIEAASRGVLVMEENASIEASTTVIGAITLAGNYKGDVVKTWTGKRTITDVNEPEYDNNVKTKYDF